MTVLASARSVGVRIGGRAILSNVDLEVRGGEVLALLGANGAGKTTLLRVLAGLLTPHRGRVDRSFREPGSIAYLAQAAPLPRDWLAREVVELGRLPKVGLFGSLSAEDFRAVHAAMQATGTLPFASRAVHTLSGGEMQRVALARALAQEPRVLLLDEPNAHLDLRHQLELMSVLRAEAARGLGVVVVLHDLSLSAAADRCALLCDGRLRTEGAPREVLRPDLIREAFGAEMELATTKDGRVIPVPVIGGNP